ncbi:DUF421 domain-containing protein [Pedobacter deserti]|uniref:DUF421 domain-containing protein n=1 Tax=Pedobacter deserti TaxID=2817382 RepID=UPI00210EEDD5|nr:YetF domain-containing protein [Pedobacter sp. SYSU D00382]
MKPDQINITDIYRILFGEVPYSFFAEAIFRALVIYVILMVSMRLMGKRMSAHMNRNEMAAMVSLAAAIGVPLMNPDRGILPAIIIAAVLIWYQRIIARRAARNEAFEAFSQGSDATLVADGRMHLENMKNSRISRERLFAQLRASEIRHLGEVRRLYLEAPGTFTLIRSDKPEPGLTILPDWDKEFIDKFEHDPQRQACRHCGNTTEYNQSECEMCKHSDWVAAIQ